jgi:hypothetical protein
MSTTWSARALGRSLNTTDPEIIKAAVEMLDDPEAEYVVRYEQGVPDDSEPILGWCEPAEEISRIVSTYLHSPHEPGLSDDDSDPDPSSEIARIAKTYLHNP